MIYTLIVTSNHLTNGRNALELAEEIIAQGNTINCIYFLFDGAYVANQYIDMPTDEFDLPQAWGKFAQANSIALTVCKASSLRRGIIDQNLASAFHFSSIGELVENCLAADKVICA